MTLLLPDLDLKNILNVVEENFEKLGLKAYACRMIYAGEHRLTRQELIEMFRRSVDGANACYCDIRVRGQLLVYDSYFVHVIEGSEDTIYRQLRFLMKNAEDYEEQHFKQNEDTEVEGLASVAIEKAEPEKRVFKGLKQLMMYHSIQTFLFDGWRTLLARPPALVTRPDPRTPLSHHAELLRICLEKMSKLYALMIAEKDLNLESLNAADPRSETLPEVALLEFLLLSPYILDLRRCIQQYRRVDDYAFYFEHTWPLPTHYTPRLLYKLKIDDSFVEPLPVMPWELVKPEKTEEEEREQDSDSSSD